MIETKVKSLTVSMNEIRGNAFVTLEVDIAHLDEFKKLEGILEGYTATLKKTRSKSLSANSYMWQLCDKIAKAIKTTKEDIYRQAIRYVGKWTDVIIEGDTEPFFASWTNNGEGWFCEVVTYFENATEIRAYIGSSVYNQEELSRLIDWVVEEAKAQNIETMTPAEIEQMMNAWGGK